MKVVLVTDIFGLCESIDCLSNHLTHLDVDLEVIDPYEGMRHSFINEQDAYDAFVKQCGHDKYLSLVSESISVVKPELIIGFSAGASAVWRVSSLDSGDCRQAICFYPTQIRNHLDIKPQIPTKVVFPCTERAFNVENVSKHISTYELVNTEITSFQHGFMNKCSAAYDLAGEAYGLKLIEVHITS
ncbi:dienelactone hydrolase family protein [Enterovibrio sp. ZSDZ42]|uniref:Dienelactone hydrolase family protein n=1 Tax=Enterovibrio gelatinilyticus TaxID=2899819 RepID=A0ABT5R124_9GAMM|nr:dienelactone hydrolase family protein [Enterovibrio sp. ZSDZ42]MDD1793966.1 dienelactone hydrolase family protein [Enterovibrio sp. ZSDZ42]